MATTLDTDVIQVRTVYARTPQNDFIPSSHILIANGDGGTRWNSVSSIFPVSSFKTVQGNTATTYSADLSNNLLKISTTGVQGTFQSYVDPLTNALMLSNSLPPYVVCNGSVPEVNTTVLNPIPNSQFLTQVTGQSSIKFLGVGDVRFSTITSQNAIFVSISSFTSRGYSTISGETFSWRPTLTSTLSTSYGRPSFISSVPFNSGWNVGSGLLFSTPTTSQDMYFSSITFNMDHIAPYIDQTRTSSSRIFIEYNPNLIIAPLTGGNTSPILEVSTFIQVETVNIGRKVFGETVITNYMTSQIIGAGSQSNYFNPSIRMEIDPYGSFLSNYYANGGNIGNTMLMTIYHRFPNANLSNLATETGFSNVNTITNLTSQRGGLYINLVNQTALL